jgi:hypothetical protein
MSSPDLRVHLSDWAGQPDIHILCDGTWTTPAWGPESALQKSLAKRDIYLGDDERYYTFEEEHVTCKSCLEKMKPKAA